MSANVKETATTQQPAGQQIQQIQGDFIPARGVSATLPGGTEWNRTLSNGHGSASDLGAIGVERKKTKYLFSSLLEVTEAKFIRSSIASTWGSGVVPSRITGPGGDAFGWPPSSHPPDLPSPSPPIPLKDVAPPSFTAGGAGIIGQPTSANPTVTASGGNVSESYLLLLLYSEPPGKAEASSGVETQRVWCINERPVAYMTLNEGCISY